jgi:glycolate oxidase
MGRMQCFALGAAGEAGVLRLLELLEDEVQRSMGLLGVTKLAELNRSYLHPAPPTQFPHALSAFNLLKLEEYRY